MTSVAFVYVLLSMALPWERAKWRADSHLHLLP